jgi:MYXO-CTERM domain-containing protein
MPATNELPLCEDKYMVQRRVSWVAALAVVLAAGPAFAYSDVITGLRAVTEPDEVPVRLRFSWQAVAMHTDVFATANLADDIAGGASADAYQTGLGGYVTLAAPYAADGLDESDRSVSYGAGNVTSLSWWDKSGVRHELDVDENMKVALGNLATKHHTVLSPGDTATEGNADLVDTLTGTPLTGGAVRIDDTNGDGLIILKTDYDYDIVEGANLYYDRNRDGVVDAGLLESPATGSASDRPYYAIYEGGPLIDISNPPLTDVDGDGIRVDNLWLGNPYVRMDDAKDADLTPEAYPEFTDMGAFTEPLLVGELGGFFTFTTINLLVPEGDQNLHIVSTGYMDVKVTDGRLYDYLAETVSAKQGKVYNPDPDELLYRGTLNASFKFVLGGDLFNELEFTDNGTLDLYAPALPEPSGALAVLGLGGFFLRRRRR